MFKRFQRVVGVLFFSMLVLLLSILGYSNSAVTRAETENASQPNIIFVVVDALRADHVSSYGYDRQTTPNVDAWIAESGVLFTDVTAAS